MRPPWHGFVARRWNSWYRRRARWRGRTYRLLLPGTFARGVRLGRGLTLENPSQISVGAGVILADGVLLATRPPTGEHTPRLVLGPRTFINNGGSLSAAESVVLGVDVLIGPNVTIVDHDHRFDDPATAVARQGVQSRGPIVIGDGVWIAANAVILGGTTIAPRSVVAANAVVRGDFPDRAVIAGAPARVVRRLP